MSDTTGAHPADLLGQLWAAIDAGQVPSTEVRAWFCEAVASAVRRSEPLDVALGLAAAGEPSLQRYLLMLLRNEYLREALAAVAVDEGADNWTRCRRLSVLIRAFEATTWPHARHLIDAPADWPDWRRAVFKAAQTDMRLPTTPRALWDVLKKAPPYPLQRRPAKVLANLLEPHACPLPPNALHS